MIRWSNAGRKTQRGSLSSYVPSFPSLPLRTHRMVIERFILCCHCCACRCIRPRSQAQFAGHFRILSQKHLSTSCRSQLSSHDYPFYPSYSPGVLSTEIFGLGERTLVLELGHQSFMYNVGDIVAAVGTTIHQDHPARTVQPTQARPGACLLCQWRRRTPCSMGG